MNKFKNYFQWRLSTSHFWGLVSSFCEVLLNLRLLSRSMSKLNDCKIKERLRQVPTLNVIILKQLKVNESRYRHFGVTPHFLKTEK